MNAQQEPAIGESGDPGAPWANGVTLKRTRDGYSWSIAVAAAASDLEAMRVATWTARSIDEELTDVYGPPTERSSSRPRVHQPSRSTT